MNDLEWSGLSIGKSDIVTDSGAMQCTALSSRIKQRCHWWVSFSGCHGNMHKLRPVNSLDALSVDFGEVVIGTEADFPINVKNFLKQHLSMKFKVWTIDH